MNREWKIWIIILDWLKGIVKFFFFIDRGKKGSSGSNQTVMVPVPLEGGKTLMVPAEASNGEDCFVDLDDAAKERLMALRSQIDNMLQIKQDS